MATRTKKAPKSETTKATATRPAKASAAPKADKRAKAQSPKAAKADGKLSAIDAAARVLGEKHEPMNTREMIEAMTAKGYWTSPGGKTPHATLYSAILREIQVKGTDARFQKTERGKFALNGSHTPASTPAKSKTARSAGREPGPKAVAELFRL
jgi:hypothetical protein